ncbi:MAG: BON domain-containing protein [Planctomycetota bacterium]|nr:BON domain-containing protein [Planctomycetota bacterium]
MNGKRWIGVAGGASALLLVAAASFAQQGIGSKVGEKLDEVGRGIKRGAQQVGEGLRKQFEVVKSDVNRMEAGSRVYARIHWDKALTSAKIEVHMMRDGAVLLRGTVADKAAHNRAVNLAMNTVGISSVIDELSSVVSSEEAAPAPPPAALPNPK